jgi:hypothetical protein
VSVGLHEVELCLDLLMQGCHSTTHIHTYTHTHIHTYIVSDRVMVCVSDIVCDGVSE